MRPFILRHGVTLYQCRNCCRWKPADAFYRLNNPESRCGIQSWCRVCSDKDRHPRRIRARERAKAQEVGAL